MSFVYSALPQAFAASSAPRQSIFSSMVSKGELCPNRSFLFKKYNELNLKQVVCSCISFIADKIFALLVSSIVIYNLVCFNCSCISMRILINFSFVSVPSLMGIVANLLFVISCFIIFNLFESFKRLVYYPYCIECSVINIP